MKFVRFEPLEARYLDAVHAIELEANPTPWSRKAFENELANPQSVFRVILGDGEVVGFGAYWHCFDEAHIVNVAVAADFRRQGLARKLIQELLSAARAQGIVCATLEVRASNEAAIRLYESFGFKTVARRRKYYPNAEDALVMWLYEV
jgi:[ribosomal protein S18]-alanine N-acetyltransferase